MESKAELAEEKPKLIEKGFPKNPCVGSSENQSK